MKKLVLSLLPFFFFMMQFEPCFSQERQSLETQKDKESYSLGYRFGETMKFQNIDLNLDVYMAGIRDALKGKEPLITEQDMSGIIQNLQQRLAEIQQKAMQELAAKNLSEGKAFLEKNAKGEGVKTLPSGLQYIILSEGTGNSPKLTDNVSVHYRGSLIDGAEFENTVSRGTPQTFRVDSVIAGWTEALQLMKEGAKWKLFIPPNLAYGERGRPPRIPPNSILIFEIELLKIQ